MSLTRIIYLPSLLVSFFWISLFFGSSAFAAAPISTGFFSDKALKGYDTVAYFTQNAAIKGLKKYRYQYKGATWQFSSQENLDAFKANPQKYAPQYGGYCSYAASINKTAPSDPEVFEVVDGKLYLNYNKDVHSTWAQDKSNHIIQADKNWPSLINN